MTKFARKMVEFLKKEDGPTAVEYAVMLALIIAVCIVSVTALGNKEPEKLQNVFTSEGPTAVKDAVLAASAAHPEIDSSHAYSRYFPRRRAPGAVACGDGRKPGDRYLVTGMLLAHRIQPMIQFFDYGKNLT